MEIRLDAYYKDLYQSFSYNRDKIDEQIDRDFHRLIYFYNGTRITTKNDFYRMLDTIHYTRIYKRLLWILPTQVTLFIFYIFGSLV